MEETSWQKYWGKAAPSEPAAHLLVYHLLDVAAVASVYLSEDALFRRRLARLMGLSAEQSVYLVRICCGVHDVGKFSVGFQQRRNDICARLGLACEPVEKKTPHHTDLGLLWWRQGGREMVRKSLRLLDNQADLPVEDFEYATESLACALFGHHGAPVSVIGGAAYVPRRIADYLRPEESAAIRAYMDALALIWPPPGPLPCYTRELEDDWRRSSWWLAGFCVLCDWLGSNDRWFLYQDRPMPLAVYWEEHALPTARRACAESGVLPVASHPFGGLGQLFPSIEKPRPAQVKALQVSIDGGPMLFVLEDETGSGKTEAACILAHRILAAGQASGLAFLLPTMATANGMFVRMRAAFLRIFAATRAEAGLTLAHSSRSLNAAYQGYLKEAEGQRAGPIWLADNRKKALLASLCVGTIDQALMAAIHVRHQALRLFGLSRSVLVVDEVHACDVYMLELLRDLLRFHAAAGGYAILLSATLPKNTRQTLVDAFADGARSESRVCVSNAYPLLSCASGRGLTEEALPASQGRAVRVLFSEEEVDIVAALVSAARNGQCACWIRNTVDDAIRSFGEFRDLVPEETLHLFHARFALAGVYFALTEIC